MKVKGKYGWQLIPAQVYAAVISRMVALSHRSNGQRLSEDGEMQFAIIDNGEIIDHRKMSDLKSFARMVDANGYEKLTEDTVKQGDK